jgi:hypothetical protein
MKTDNYMVVFLRILCWIVVVIIPTGVICWLARIHNIGMIGVALPFILIAERAFRVLLSWCQHHAMRNGSTRGDLEQ